MWRVYGPDSELDETNRVIADDWDHLSGGDFDLKYRWDDDLPLDRRHNSMGSALFLVVRQEVELPSGGREPDPDEGVFRYGPSVFTMTLGEVES